MTTADLPQIIQRKLGDVRQKLAVWFWIDGISRLMITLLILFGLSLALDCYFRMDRPQRLIMLLIMISFAAWVIYRRLIRPLRKRLDDDALAMQVERRHRELGDGLISALQLSRADDLVRMGASPELLAEAVRQGADRSAAVNFNDVIDGRRRNRALAWGVGSAIVLIVMSLSFGSVMSTWANRNLMLGRQQWPQETYLRVQGLNEEGVLVVPTGDDMVLRVEAKGVVPNFVSIDHQPAGGRKTTEQMALVGENQFHITFKNVLGEFRFRIRGNDAVTDYYKVVTVDRPTLIKDQGLSIVVHPPTYIGAEPYALQTNTGSFNVPFGSTIEIVGYATKPLQSGTIELGREWTMPMTISDAPQQRVEKSGDSFEEYPAGPRKVSVMIPPDKLATGAYGIRLQDADGLASKRPVRFILKVQNDREPTVRAVLRGIGDLITERAMVPLAIRATDDYAITALSLEYSVGGSFDETVESIPPQIVAITGDHVPELPTDRIDEFVHKFDVEPLALVPGVMVSFTVQATDNDMVTNPQVGPKVGKSTTFTLKVVTEEELRAELLRRESEQRVEFERTIKQQEELIVDARALEAGVLKAREQGKLTDDRFTLNQMRQLGQIEKVQRLTAGRCDSVAAQYVQILQEVVNNRLEEQGGPWKARMQLRIIDPLRVLAGDTIPPVADQFDGLRTPSLTLDQRLANLRKAIEAQEQLLDRMNTIKRSMIKSEGYQEMVNLLREILKAQQGIEDKTIRELEKQIEDIFDD